MGEEQKDPLKSPVLPAGTTAPINTVISKPTKAWVYLILLVLILGGGILYWKHAAKKNSTMIQSKATAATPTPTTYNYKLPAGFPSGMPIETGAITVNTSSVKISGSNSTVASREFISNQTADANLSVYGNWLVANKWQNINSVNNARQKILSATLGKNNLTIRIFTALDGKIHVAIENIVSQ